MIPNGILVKCSVSFKKSKETEQVQNKRRSDGSEKIKLCMANDQS